MRIRLLILGAALLLALAALLSPAASRVSGAQQALSPATVVVGQLQASIPSIGQIDELTSLTDPDQLLGLPGQYVAKTTFHDNALGSGDPGAPNGSVEVFLDARGLNGRKTFLSLNGIAQYEFEKARGTVLLRVNSLNPPGYDAAFGAVSLP